MSFRLKNLITKPICWFVLALLLSTGISVQSYLLGTKVTNDVVHTHYNNFVLFKYSFSHMLEGINPYQYFPQEHFDIYKYSPTFALFFGFFSLFPDSIGLILWNGLNAVGLVWAIFMLKGLTQYQKSLVFFLSVVELATSLQNSQANGLMAALMIFSLAMLQRNKIVWAALCIALSFYIKLFGIVAFSLFLFYPGKLRMVFWSVCWFAALAFMPILVVDFDGLINLYKQWFAILQADHASNYGFSLMGWLHRWFNLNPDKLVVLALGVITFFLCLGCGYILRKKENTLYVLLALVLLWVILFNHMTESATVIIGMTGAALWFAVNSDDKLNKGLIVLAVLFTSLSSTELFPRSIRSEWIYPYVVKVFPLILIWIKLQFDLLKPAVLTLSQNLKGTHLQDRP
ncbi:MAG: glycosyltransferase family 87 protein [Bacteroidia bacterium]|jgi:hypothetical protein